MAISVVGTVAETATAAPGSATVAITLPATTVSGEVVVMGLVSYAGAGVSSGPSGWTSVGSFTYVSTTLNVYAITSDGALGSSVNVTFNSTPTAVTAQVWRASGASGAADVEVSASAGTGNSSHPNPAIVSPSWGSAENLYLEFVGGTNDDESFTLASTGYSGLVSTISGGGVNAGCEIGSAYKIATSSSDDPGTMTMSGAEDYIGVTVAVKASAGATYSESLSVGLGMGAAAGEVLNALETATQSLTLGAAAGELAALQEALSEGLSLGQSTAPVASYSESVAESVGLGASQVAAAAIAESLLAGIGIGLAVVGTPASSFQESLTQALDFAVAVQDVAQLGEALTIALEFSVAQSEAGAFQASVTVPAVFGASVGESLNAQEALTLGVEIGQMLALASPLSPPDSRTAVMEGQTRTVTMQASGRTITIQSRSRTRTVQ